MEISSSRSTSNSHKLFLKKKKKKNIKVNKPHDIEKRG